MLPVAQIVAGEKVQLALVGEQRIKAKKGSSPGSRGKGLFRGSLKKTFIPENVSGDYWQYARWRFLQRITASVLSVYSTECMLRAIGVGAKRSLPTAAAFNWLLKDGIGKLGKLGIVAKLGSQYDLELKKFRLLSTVVCDFSCGLEMLTPFWPRNFLLLASMGNVGKSVGLSIALATQPAFHKKFSLSDNMADITAKSQAQHVVADQLGLGIALGLSHLANSVSPKLRMALPVLSFPVLAAMDILLVHRELRAIDLRTLNRDRSQLLASHWVHNNKEALGLAAVSKRDNMTFLPFSPEGDWPLKVRPLSDAVTDADALFASLGHYANERYMLIPTSPRDQVKRNKELVLCCSAAAEERDLLKGILQASYFRMLQKQAQREKEERENSSSSSSSAASGYDDLIQQSKRLAEQNVNQFIKDIAAKGWQTSKLFLFDSQHPKYVVDSDWKRQMRRQRTAE